MDREVDVSAGPLLRQTWAVLDSLIRRVGPEEINIEQPGWLKDILILLLDSLKDLASESPLCAEVLDDTVAVIVNYGSVSDPGGLGGRHTAALLNLDKLRGGKLAKATPREMQVGVVEQNHVRTFTGRKGTHSRIAPMANAVAEQRWKSNWAEYLSIEEGGDVFTLNNMLLGQADKPRPTLIAFADDVDPARDSEVMELMPVGLSVVAKAPAKTDFAGFAEKFAGMFHPAEPGFYRGAGMARWRIDAQSTEKMIMRLHRHFATLGGRVFASFPTTYSIGRHGSDELGIANMRAVLSIVCSRPWSRTFYEKAWLLFGGIASRVLYRILAGEFEGMARRRWQRQQADAVYLVGHTLKHRVVPIGDGVALLNEALADLTALKPQPKPAEAILALTAAVLKLRSDAAMLRGIVNLISVLKDVTPLTESRIKENLTEAGGARDIDLMEALREASSWTYTGSVGRTVRLVGDSKAPLRVASRFRIQELAHHAGEEKFLYATLFSELLQNAATYGKRSQRGLPIPVLVRRKLQQISLYNAIDISSLEKAKIFAEQHRNRDQKRQSSGTYFAEVIASSFQLMDFEFDVNQNEEQLPFFGKTDWIWCTTMLIKE